MPSKLPEGEHTRSYVINLRSVYSAPRKKRSKVAIRKIREFVARHLRYSGAIKIDPRLNELLWSRSIEKPPRKVKLDVKFTVEDGEISEVTVLPQGIGEKEAE
jgi:large subunit ribosomal protein L31e